MFLLPVRSVERIAPGIFDLSLERRGYPFVSGECAVLFNEAGDSRPYSIASAPDEDALHFLFRRIDGGAVSPWLAGRKPGDGVRISTPFGEFRPRLSADGGEPNVWIATGVGIAPFRSLVRGLARAGAAAPAHKPVCLYGVRRRRDAVDLELFEKYTDLRLAVSRERVPGCHHGRVTDLMDGLRAEPGAEFYLCGLDAMVDEAAAWLQSKRIGGRRVHVEVFFSSASR